MEFVAEPCRSGRIFLLCQERGRWGISNLLKYFIALYYRQGGKYLLHVIPKYP
jgi:hypothetical protein